MVKSINFSYKYLTLGLLLLCVNPLWSTLKLNGLISDNMVFQQKSTITINGQAQPGQNIKIIVGWSKKAFQTKTNENGNWSVIIKTSEPGGPYSITISTKNEKKVISNIMIGEVWICAGQSNMEMTMSGFGDSPVNNSLCYLLKPEINNIRMVTVRRKLSNTPMDTCSARWEKTNSETVKYFSAVGYFYALKLQQMLNIPIGIINVSWGGSKIESWISSTSIDSLKNTFTEAPLLEKEGHRQPSEIYNGMLSPIRNTAFKGVIWYQGESNVSNASQYPALLRTMVYDWKRLFTKKDLPLIVVQIAPCQYGKSKNRNAALMREKQVEAVAGLNNSYIVTTVDLGEEFNIHPPEKEKISERLSLLSLSNIYGFSGLNYRSPLLKSYEIKDSVVIIKFSDAEKGFTNYGNPVQCFEVAGADSVFQPAEMTIRNKTVIVSSPKVKAPLAVRYAFRNFSITKGFLYNTMGMPVFPFRTDNWIIKQ